MADHLSDLRAQAREFPKMPGVYFWYDGRGKILYIGKATNLRARVTSYFSNAQRDRRTRDLLDRARTVRCEVTSTELEALLRESSLIKKEQPPFNRLLRTSRRPYYLKLDGDVADPYLEVAREVGDDGSLYFGPFHSGVVIRETVAFLHGILPLRKCTKPRPRCGPCLYHHMGTCAAPLLDEEHRRQHQEAISKLNDLLDGRTDRVVAWLKRKRDRLSESLLFEQAALIQTRLDTLQDLMRRQVVLEAAVRCRHVLVRDEGRNGDQARILFVARGRVLGVRSIDGLTPEGLRAWVRAHEKIATVTQNEQSEIDAASVLEGWVRCHRERVRWVAVPGNLADADLDERLAYLTQAEASTAVAAPVT